MKAEDYDGRRILVVGLARSGVASAEFLLGRGAQVKATDLRSKKELSGELSGLNQKGVELVLGSHPTGLVGDVELVIVSPGVPFDAPPLKEARAKSIPIWGELELGFRQIEGPLIAVTGTKGKSTTTSLLAEILRRAGRKVALGGNIGRPLISLVEGSDPDTLFVVEVSSFQLETIERFHPHIAVLLDVTPDHLDRHVSFEDYARAKAKIFANQEAGDWAIVYGGNPLTVQMAKKARSNKVYFSFERIDEDMPYVSVDGPWIVKHDGGETTALVSLERIGLRGRHNVENVMAACSAASMLGLDPEILSMAVGDFRGIPHALERVGEVDGVAFYNDSKATNLASAKAALDAFDGGVLLIVGGRYKGGDFEALRTHVKRNVKRVLAIGETKKKIALALGDLVPVDSCRSLREAVRSAFRHATPGDTILLSPACASFDMFRDYEERGERFREEVEKLVKTRGKTKSRAARDKEDEEQ
jgi:UDP-N-acetylmuramoylalanine--D-glutamate ligase